MTDVIEIYIQWNFQNLNAFKKYVCFIYPAWEYKRLLETDLILFDGWVHGRLKYEITNVQDDPTFVMEASKVKADPV